MFWADCSHKQIVRIFRFMGTSLDTDHLALNYNVYVWMILNIVFIKLYFFLRSVSFDYYCVFIQTMQLHNVLLISGPLTFWFFFFV